MADDWQLATDYLVIGAGAVGMAFVDALIGDAVVDVIMVDSTAEKNRLLPPNPFPDTPFDYLRSMVMGMNTELQWPGATDLQAWVDESRLNVLKELPASEERTRLEDLQGCFLTAVFPAVTKLREFAVGVTPAEHERMFDPAVPEGT